MAHGLSCPEARGIVPGQGSKPCPLRGQGDSLPLSHQETPTVHALSCSGSFWKTQKALKADPESLHRNAGQAGPRGLGNVPTFICPHRRAQGNLSRAVSESKQSKEVQSRQKAKLKSLQIRERVLTRRLFLWQMNHRQDPRAPPAVPLISSVCSLFNSVSPGRASGFPHQVSTRAPHNSGLLP